MRLTVITGPPCSGKSTYAKQNAKRGDVVIDLDVIAASLTSQCTPSHGYDKTIRRIALDARSAAITASLQTDRDVWLIDSAPSSPSMQTYRQHNAHIVSLSEPVDELVRRAKQDQRPDETVDLIKAWKAELEVSRSW